MKRKLLLLFVSGLLVTGVSCRHTLEPKTDLEKLVYKIEGLGGKVTLDDQDKVIVGVILLATGSPTRRWNRCGASPASNRWTWATRR